MDVQLYVYDLSQVSFALFSLLIMTNRQYRVLRAWYAHSRINKETVSHVAL